MSSASYPTVTASKKSIQLDPRTKLLLLLTITTLMSVSYTHLVEDGRIAQRGTHAELMAQGGLYRRFIEIREQAEGWRLA